MSVKPVVITYLTITYLLCAIERDSKVFDELIRLGGADTFGLSSNIKRNTLLVMRQSPRNLLEAKSKYDFVNKLLAGCDGDNAGIGFRDGIEFWKMAVKDLYKFSCYH